MGKLGLLFGLAIGIILFASFGSASYYLDYPSYIDGRSYTSTSYQGYGGAVSSRTTSYDRVSTSGFVGRDYVRTTGYVRTTVDSPSYGYGGYGGYYGPGYSYSRPWYQRYWDTPSYYRSGYVSPRLPRTSYWYGY